MHDSHFLEKKNSTIVLREILQKAKLEEKSKRVYSTGEGETYNRQSHLSQQTISCNDKNLDNTHTHARTHTHAQDTSMSSSKLWWQFVASSVVQLVRSNVALYQTQIDLYLNAR